MPDKNYPAYDVHVWCSYDANYDDDSLNLNLILQIRLPVCDRATRFNLHLHQVPNFRGRRTTAGGAGSDLFSLNKP